MKRILFAAILANAMMAKAQDTYLNYSLTQGSDLYGTARYVGMGGATGALGAEISGISLNPAGIGLYRRGDLVFTAGFVRQNDSRVDKLTPVHGSFDQIGAVMAFRMGNDGMKYINFAMNYQKKADFRYTFVADQRNTNGLSLSHQMADVANNPHHGAYYDAATKNYHMPSALSQALYEAGVIFMDENGKWNGQDTNVGSGEYVGNQYRSESEGGVHSFDFNLSGNYEERFFWGVTVGLDYLKYINNSYYTEYSTDSNDQVLDFYSDSWKKLTGVGANAKVGIITRPIEDSPLRLGLAIESPTFYSIKMDSQVEVSSYTEASSSNVYPDMYTFDPVIGYLDYNLRSPWRFRASAGYTVGKWMALGVDYEYAMYNRTKVSYGGDWEDDFDMGDSDYDLNDFTVRTLKGVHGVRVGTEIKPGKHISVRAGYNYYSQAHKKDAYLCHDVSLSSMDVATTAHYMNLSDVNIVTIGLGYKAKHAYFDLAYKYRAQSGQFYAHDDCYYDNTGRFVHLSPTNVNLDRHQMFFTLGYKF